jgi:hypothetical protein
MKLLRAAVLVFMGAAAARAQMNATMVGHEFRQDDWPSIAAAPDGSMWIAWLSFAGDRDDVVIRHYADGKWSNLQWVPNTSGDSAMPQVAVDASNRVSVVWTQQVNGNWDLYARRYDPLKQEWSAVERLTSDPLPDINPRMVSDGKGRFALVWQGFRGKNSNIFLKTFDGEKWSRDIRVTNRAANDWEPAAAFDSKGNVWVAYDSYKNGNYDIFLTEVRAGEVQPEKAVATTPRFEARATVAVDSADRVWVAWETAAPNWGKDSGYVIHDREPGQYLGAERDVEIRALENGQWKTPAVPLISAFTAKRTYQPYVFADSRGSVCVLAKVMKSGPSEELPNAQVYWEYEGTRLLGESWLKTTVVPHSTGRSSTRINAAVAKNGALWMTWPTENRSPKYYNRPLRAEVYAGSIHVPHAAVTEFRWKSGAEEAVAAKPGHNDEAGDLRAIRAYTATIGGKPHHIVRGDFHRHTEFSWDAGGFNDGSLHDFYRYMIDCAAMDFGASTDHQGGGWPLWWWYSQKLADMYHVPGAYVPIFGYERSAVYPNGHRNIFFVKRSESRVIPFFLMAGASGKGFGGYSIPRGAHGDEPEISGSELAGNDTKMLYEELRWRNGIAIPHTSATKMGTDWRDNDNALEPVVEIFQGDRTSYEQPGAPLAINEDKYKDMADKAGFFPKGFINNAWAKGYKLGVICSSDHYSTHISYVLAYTDDRTRQGILNAIRKRHTYGAMDNIILDVRMGDHFMGDEFALAAPQPLHVKIHGTDAVAAVAVLRDSAVIYTVQPNRRDVEFEYKDAAAPKGHHYYYVRVQQKNDMLAWSSPMFITY